MIRSRTGPAIGLAVATLVVFVVVITMGGALQAGLAPWAGVAVAVLATSAFTVSREHKSFAVAGLLAVSGVVGVVYALLRTEFLTDTSFPGPIFGMILGIPLLGLAAAEAFRANQDRRGWAHANNRPESTINRILDLAFVSALEGLMEDRRLEPLGGPHSPRSTDLRNTLLELLHHTEDMYRASFELETD